MLDKHVGLIEEASGRGVEVLCLQELFTGPYFPAEAARPLAAGWRSRFPTARRCG